MKLLSLHFYVPNKFYDVFLLYIFDFIEIVCDFHSSLFMVRF